MGPDCLYTHTAVDPARLEEEREEKQRAKAWIRKAKMRRVLAEMEEQESQSQQQGESKIQKLLQEDQESQHIMGLIQVRGFLQAARKRCDL